MNSSNYEEEIKENLENYIADNRQKSWTPIYLDRNLFV